MSTEQATQYDDDGLHGEEWEPVIELLWEMEKRRFGGGNSHPVGSKLELRWTCISDLRNEADSALTWSETVVYSEAIREAGTEVINAWLRADVEFFKEFARRLENASVVRREVDASGKRSQVKMTPVYETIINTAFGLVSKERGNPTKQEVRAAVEKEGLIVGDWTKAWKKCRLTFLADGDKSPRKSKRVSSGVRVNRERTTVKSESVC